MSLRLGRCPCASVGWWERRGGRDALRGDIYPLESCRESTVLWGDWAQGPEGMLSRQNPSRHRGCRGGRPAGALRARDGPLTAAASRKAQGDPARSIRSPALSQPHPPSPVLGPGCSEGAEGAGGAEGFPSLGLTLWCPHLTQKQQDGCYHGRHPFRALPPAPQHPPPPLEKLPYRVHHSWFKSDPTSLGLRLLTCAVGS